MHLALNVGALLIGTWVFYPARTPIAWAIAQIVCSVVSSLGLYFFSPEIAWCVGMSGALHGLLMIGAIDWIRQGDRVGWLLLAIWTGKLAWEQFNGAMPFSTETVGSRGGHRCPPLGRRWRIAVCCGRADLPAPRSAYPCRAD